jgi:3-methyladenine DNA glycosylase AlkD
MTNKSLIKSFYDNGNPEKAVQMAAYIKNNFPFLGIPKPERSLLQKEFIKAARKEKSIDWDFVFMLWDLPEREFQYLAVDYLAALKKSLHKNDIDKLESLLIKKSWWDSVDIMAESLVGSLCLLNPGLINSHVLKWNKNKNIWLVRTSILFQLKYKKDTDTQILTAVITTNSNTNEFFINKAIGWALREYSKTNQEWVKDFIDNHSLNKLSVREASKYLYDKKLDQL